MEITGMQKGHNKRNQKYCPSSPRDYSVLLIFVFLFLNYFFLLVNCSFLIYLLTLLLSVE